MPSDQASPLTTSGPPPDVAGLVVERLHERPPTLGPGRLVCIDGPAGSGKTTLAEAMVEVTGAAVVHTDDLLQGWRGLPGLAGSVADLLAPLSLGRAGTWRQWDWSHDRWADEHRVEPGPLLVLDGTGSWSPRIAPWVTALVWVEAPSPLRLARGLARDGEQMRAEWEQWRVDEDELHARTRTRDHADLVVRTG